MNKIRILLTGGSGFIGTNVVDDFIKLNYDFINVDISKPKNADHNIFWKDISLTDKQSLKKYLKITGLHMYYILHPFLVEKVLLLKS